MRLPFAVDFATKLVLQLLVLHLRLANVRCFGATIISEEKGGDCGDDEVDLNLQDLALSLSSTWPKCANRNRHTINFACSQTYAETEAHSLPSDFGCMRCGVTLACWCHHDCHSLMMRMLTCADVADF